MRPKSLPNVRADKCLIDLMKTEYELFRLVERQLVYARGAAKWYKDIDDFLSVANRITNRRKSRAGRSLENHVEFLLSAAGVPFDIRPDIDGRPDVIIPSRDAYDDPAYIGPLYMVGIKTTCKDRWRQVLNEATKLPQKHLLTMQEGISTRQLAEMKKAQITLIVPTPLHSRYPKDRPMPLLGVETFIDGVLKALN